MEDGIRLFICPECGKNYVSKADMYRCMAEDLDRKDKERRAETEKWLGWTKQLRAIKKEIDDYNTIASPERKVSFHVEIELADKGVYMNDDLKEKERREINRKNEEKECKACGDKCKCKSPKKDPWDVSLNLLNFTDADHNKLLKDIGPAKIWRDLGLFDDIRVLTGENLSDEELTKIFNETMKDPEIKRLTNELKKKKEENNIIKDWQKIISDWWKEEAGK